MSKTITIMLARGYVDPDGRSHREVVLRAPLVDDEIKADAAVATRASQAPGERESAALWKLCFLRECIVSLGEIRQVDVDTHLRSLTRHDVGRLDVGLGTLEASLEAVELDEGKSGDELSSSSSPS